MARAANGSRQRIGSAIGVALGRSGLRSDPLDSPLALQSGAMTSFYFDTQSASPWLCGAPLNLSPKARVPGRLDSASCSSSSRSALPGGLTSTVRV